MADAQRWFLGDPRPAAEFYKSRGYYAAGPEALIASFEEVTARFKEVVNSGGYFRARVEDVFEWVRRFISQGWGLEVGVVDRGCGELLLSDTPALTISHRTQRFGVALGDANAVILPLGPRHLATLGPTNQYLPMSAELVEFCNTLQVRAAQKYVYLRPGSNLERFVAHVRRHDGHTAVM